MWASKFLQKKIYIGNVINKNICTNVQYFFYSCFIFITKILYPRYFFTKDVDISKYIRKNQIFDYCWKFVLCAT